jgi:hypothetical protein
MVLSDLATARGLTLQIRDLHGTYAQHAILTRS